MLPYFSIAGITIYSYPLILGIIWGISYKLGKDLNSSFKLYNLYIFGLFISSWAGAKAFFLLSLDQNLIHKAIESSHFWLGGGFVFYGGLVFGALFTIFFGVKQKLSLKDFEFTIPLLALGHGIGRIGCFLAGCCYGTHCELPWAIELNGISRHPVQLYEAFILIVFAGILIQRLKKNKPLISLYFLVYAILRFILEFFRGDEIRGGFGYFSTSQWISLFIILFIVLIRSVSYRFVKST